MKTSSGSGTIFASGFMRGRPGNFVSLISAEPPFSVHVTAQELEACHRVEEHAETLVGL